MSQDSTTAVKQLSNKLALQSYDAWRAVWFPDLPYYGEMGSASAAILDSQVISYTW